MTALDQYARLEAPALWRPAAAAQRRDVVVSLGEATLVISDLSDCALAHWSLAAVARANPGDMPALFHPDGDPDELLEIGADGAEMIAAIETLRSAIRRRRPRKGRLRLAGGLGSAAIAVVLAVVWLPEALVTYALNVVPPAQRSLLGEALLTRVLRLTGAPCTETTGVPALGRLADRLSDGDTALRLVVVAEGLAGVRQLPGGIVIVDRRLIEEQEGPDVLAGHVLAATRATAQDPLDPLLRAAGSFGTLRLLTTGALPAPVLTRQAEALLTRPPAPPDPAALLDAFAAAEIRATPYARSLSDGADTGQGALAAILIADDPWPDLAPRPVLVDADWVRLQGICGG